MSRADAVALHFQKAAELTVAKKNYQEHLTELFLWMVKADAVTDDITSKTLSLMGKSTTRIVSKQGGMIAGIEELAELLTKHTKLTFSSLINDGERVAKETLIAEVIGENTEILAYERTILNILGRM